MPCIPYKEEEEMMWLWQDLRKSVSCTLIVLKKELFFSRKRENISKHYFWASTKA